MLLCKFVGCHHHASHGHIANNKFNETICLVVYSSICTFRKINMPLVYTPSMAYSRPYYDLGMPAYVDLGTPYPLPSSLSNIICSPHRILKRPSQVDREMVYAQFGISKPILHPLVLSLCQFTCSTCNGQAAFEC
jgi:hypothetical protein